MLYNHFTEKLIGLQDLIVTKVESCCRFTIDVLQKIKKE